MAILNAPVRRIASGAALAGVIGLLVPLAGIPTAVTLTADEGAVYKMVGAFAVLIV